MNKIKPVAIYLPQFHPIPENDLAWGEGFTDWTNVKKTEPFFEGHYQPHVPHEDVGYYDLRDPEILVRQAAMAQKYGIYGFAFYHYWFNGKRLLNTPVDNMLAKGRPDFPFIFIWANENWTKRWDGLDNEIILKQYYSHQDDLEHISFLCRNVFSDKRYITIDDKPVFMVYRTELLPDIKETAKIWRSEAKKSGFKDLFLVRVENVRADINPLDIGFDASMEFAPDFRSIDPTKAIKIQIKNIFAYDYISTAENMSRKVDRSFPWFRCVFPGWDNSARRPAGGLTYLNNTPDSFRQFFYRAAEYTKRTLNGNSRFLFINSWNEWGEGCHVEPDKKNGYSYLEAIDAALNDTSDKNLSEYIYFLEKSLKIRIDEHDELESLKLSHDKIMSSRGHKLMDSLLLWYRKLKRIIG